MAEIKFRLFVPQLIFFLFFFLFFLRCFFETICWEFHNSFLLTNIVNLADLMRFALILKDSIPADTCIFFDG